MQRIKQDLRRKYSAVRLYKDDLDDIINILEKNCKKIDIEADGYKLTDKSQIDSIKKPIITDFAIKGELEPNAIFDNIRLRLSHDAAYVAIDDDSNIHYLGMLSQVDKILRKRGRIINILVSNITLFIAVSILIIISSVYTTITASSDKNTHTLIYNPVLYFILVPILLLLLIFNFWAVRIRLNKHSVIYLQYISSRTSFIKRNGDQILLLLVGTIIGSIGTIIVTWITNQFH